MDIQIQNPLAAYCLLLPAALIVLGVWGRRTRRQKLARFSSAKHHERLFWTRRYSAFAMLMNGIALILLAFAMMDIRWGKTERKVPQRGMEVMFVLDVSRSMLAQDCSPSRLKRAKQQIEDMMAEMAGDRVGLVVFAGEAQQEIPLTNHYEDFLKALDAVTPDSVNVGGSRLGEALTKASEGFLEKTNGHRTIVVFTDGEDQESDPVGVAKNLAQSQHTRIFTIGLGDLESGSRIPVPDEEGGGFVEFEGQTVYSRLDGATLKEVAVATGGAYIPAGTKQVDMSDVYYGFVADVEKTEFESATITAYVPRYHWFAVPSLLLILAEIWMQTMPAAPTGGNLLQEQMT